MLVKIDNDSRMMLVCPFSPSKSKAKNPEDVGGTAELPPTKVDIVFLLECVEGRLKLQYIRHEASVRDAQLSSGWRATGSYVGAITEAMRAAALHQATVDLSALLLDNAILAESEGV